MTQRFKLTLAYQGTAYHGWQLQPGKATVQQQVEAALSTALREPIQVVGASRTDAGVHALGQVAHFDSRQNLDPYPVQKSLSALLPADISVVSLIPVDSSFHAQKSAVLKHYVYYFYVSPLPYTFWEPYAWQLFTRVDIEAMSNAAQALVGRHNFLSFCAANSTVKTFEREIQELHIGHGETVSPLYHLHVCGNGFLKFMIRNIMGTLVEVGQGKRSVASVQSLLGKQDRRAAGPTAPARGLFLEKISYGR